MKYFVKLDNQLTEVPEDIAVDDIKLRKVLATFLPDMTNAKVDRTVNDAKDVIITVSAIPGKKG